MDFRNRVIKSWSYIANRKDRNTISFYGILYTIEELGIIGVYMNIA